MKDFKCQQDSNANIVQKSHSSAHHGKLGTNINLRAAFIHVVGDLLQSLGVLAAAIIIKITGYRLADPLCTFLFSALVLVRCRFFILRQPVAAICRSFQLTTFSVVRDSVFILMEASPKHINVDGLYTDLCAIEGL
ncbi:unnamed protein product, partial [Gongylonema pulchrum]